MLRERTEAVIAGKCRCGAALLAVALTCMLVCPGHATSHPWRAVSAVASDDEALRAPAPRTVELTTAQVSDMVRRAVDLVGGMDSVVPDTTGLVVIKPNICEAEHASGSGVVTDNRVVRAVAELVHEAAPGARILVAEGGGGWAQPELVEEHGIEVSANRLGDGFETAGYRDMVAQLRDRGIDIECFDLNFDEVHSLRVPAGGLARDEYDIAASIVDADVWINCPVAKTHGAKITCCMKNRFGILPGRVYGWNKSSGTEGHPGIPHTPRVIDEAYTDVFLLAPEDLCVVDMIAGSEGGAFQGRPKRSNLVLAGRSPVATDLVVGRLMGLNPDDFEFADLAWQRGHGPGTVDSVQVRGGRVEELSSRFKKAGVDYEGAWREQASYGMGPRRWSLLGPLPRDHGFTSDEIRDLAPIPGSAGWSPVVWFGHDKIDLDKHFDDPVDCSVYAFTYFSMARSDSVRFWVGSDEGLTIWIDDERVYEHQGRRRHRLGMVSLPGYVRAGEHRLLVRAEQSRGAFDFSVNICEPIDDELYAGNRYPGVRYYPAGDVGDRRPVVRVKAEDTDDDWVTPYYESNIASEDPVQIARTAPDTVQLEHVPTPAGGSMSGVAAAVAGLATAELDSATMACVSELPFGMGYIGHHGWTPKYGPEPARILGWLGLRHDVRAGQGRRETLRAVKGWLASGRVPVLGSGKRNWYALSGYRQNEDRVEVHFVAADTTGWMEVTEDWWAPFPGGRWQSCPVIVVEPRQPPLSTPALVDSLAAVALEMALQEWTELDPQPWGARRFPTGLRGWDAWVIAWERLPLTLAWAQEHERVIDDLSELGEDWSLTSLIEMRRLASGCFARAAEQSGDETRSAGFLVAAQAYAEVADNLEELMARAPTGVGDELDEDDEPIFAQLRAARPLLRRAREAERRALAALARLLDRPELPPAREDPLKRRDRGRRLATWQASFSQGICDLTLSGGDLLLTHVTGWEPDGVNSEVCEPFPRESGWQVAVEAVQGDGMYQILQQPHPGNEWTTIVRVDDGWVRDSAPELNIWAVPEEE